MLNGDSSQLISAPVSNEVADVSDGGAGDIQKVSKDIISDNQKASKNTLKKDFGSKNIVNSVVS